MNQIFSNVSLDSGLSQSYSVCPASNESSRPVDDDIKELPLHVSQSTPAFGTEYKSAYLPTSPEGSMSSCNPSDSITSLSDGNHDDIFNRADNSMNTHTFVIPPPPPPPALSMTFPRKKALRPRVNLKPLHWKRILVDNKSTLLSRPLVKPSTVWEKIKEPKIDAEELEELFAVENEKDKLTNLPSPMLTIRKKNFTKVLERKRSQNLGIILSSIRQPFSEFKKALLNFDESFLTIDTWRSLYEVRATEKEMTEIRDQVETNPKCVLDKPEQFLYNLSKLPFGLERIQCFLLRANFEEVLRDMTSLVKDMTSVCDYMVTSPHIHNLLALLLAVGNYLNGGNTHRGQADGFTLDILPKLKDIKGKKQTTLLKYIASKYQSLHGSEKRRVELPLPSHSTLEAVSCTNYTELSEQMTSLQSQLSDCGDLMSKVKSTLSDQSCNELFYNVMSGFVLEANREVTALSQSVTGSKVKFAEMCKFYSAPNVDWSKTIPSQFFEPWKTFSKDLTQVWDCKGPPALHSRVSAFF
ncbi:capu [Bugula neritina]|uniref:Capu n=1 Tax=Bugula neritina TaxID=10212 RepID=A0A7J7JQN2_BUGNE|nr:capu [Bugula neritina]